MKAKYLCIAMGLVAPLAMAQTKLQVNAATQLELFGVFDVSVSSFSADGNGSYTRLEPDGNTSSRLGVRGTSELGGGLKANLWIEAAMNPDNGTGGTSSTDNVAAPTGGGGLTWGRRSTIGLQGDFGEVRLGRDYVPTFGNLSSMHPFGTNGVGNAGQLSYPVGFGGTTARTNVRASNSVGYFLPEMGGLYGTVMVAFGEQQQGLPTSTNAGNYTGLRIGYSNKELNVSAATGTTTYATGDYTQTNAGLTYKLGDIKLMGLWAYNKVGTADTTAITLGTQWTMGPGEIRIALTDLKANGYAATVSDASQVTLGYVHSLGRSTKLYATGSQVTNKNAGKQFSVNNDIKTVNGGGNTTGFDLGIVYSF